MTPREWVASHLAEFLVAYFSVLSWCFWMLWSAMTGFDRSGKRRGQWACVALGWFIIALHWSWPFILRRTW